MELLCALMVCGGLCGVSRCFWDPVIHIFQGRLGTLGRQAGLTSEPKLCMVRSCIVSSNVVFVFTLDCNNRIYCYDTGDGFLHQPSG